VGVALRRNALSPPSSPAVSAVYSSVLCDGEKMNLNARVNALLTTTFTAELHVIQPTVGHIAIISCVSVTMWQAGVDADNILAAAHTLSHADKAELQDRTLLLLTNQMNRFLTSRSVGARRFQFNVKSLLSATCCRICDRRSVTDVIHVSFIYD